MSQNSEAAQGAAGGALTGASIGAVAGPWGAAVGGVVGGVAGGLSGYFGYEDPNKSKRSEYERLLKSLSDGYRNRVAPQASTSFAGRSSLEGNRAGLIAQLEAQARGDGPSAARLQMKDGMDRAAAAQASAAAGAGGRGVNAGAALRNATNNSQAIMMQGNRDMGVMRAQEQLNATGQLGQVLGQGINADNQLNTWNAGAANQGSQFNADMAMRQLGLNDAGQLQALMLAAGLTPGPQIGMGPSLLAGGATAAPGIASGLNNHYEREGQAQQQAAQQQQQQQTQQQALQGTYMDSLGRPTTWEAKYGQGR